MPPFKQNPENSNDVENISNQPKSQSKRNFLVNAFKAGVGIAATVAGGDTLAKGPVAFVVASNAVNMAGGDRSQDQKMEDAKKERLGMEIEIQRTDEKIAYLKGLNEEQMEVINKHFSYDVQKLASDPTTVVGTTSALTGLVGGVAMSTATHITNKEKENKLDSIENGIIATGVGAVTAGVALSSSLTINEYLKKPKIVHDMSITIEKYFVEAFFDKGKVLTKNTVIEEVDHLQNRKKELLYKFKNVKEVVPLK